MWDKGCLGHTSLNLFACLFCHVVTKVVWKKNYLDETLHNKVPHVQGKNIQAFRIPFIPPSQSQNFLVQKTITRQIYHLKLPYYFCYSLFYSFYKHSTSRHILRNHIITAHILNAIISILTKLPSRSGLQESCACISLLFSLVSKLLIANLK